MRIKGLTKAELLDKIAAVVCVLEKESVVKQDRYNLAYSQDKVGVTIGIVKK